MKFILFCFCVSAVLAFSLGDSSANKGTTQSPELPLSAHQFDTKRLNRAVHTYPALEIEKVKEQELSGPSSPEMNETDPKPNQANLMDRLRSPRAKRCAYSSYSYYYTSGCGSGYGYGYSNYAPQYYYGSGYGGYGQNYYGYYPYNSYYSQPYYWGKK